MKKLIIVSIVFFLVSCASGGSETAVRDDPKESFAYHYNLGLAALESQNYAKAIGHFKNSLALNNRIPRTHNEMGLCYLYMGELNNAINSFETALSLNSDMPEAHNALGVAYMRLGDTRSAEQHFNAALSSPSYPTPFIPLYNLGLMYVKQGHDEYALTKFKQAMSEEDKVSLDYRIYINYEIGSILFRNGKYKEAIEHFEKVLVLNPKLADAAFKAGVSAYNLNNRELAIVMFERVNNNMPNSELAQQARQYLIKLGKK